MFLALISHMFLRYLHTRASVARLLRLALARLFCLTCRYQSKISSVAKTA